MSGADRSIEESRKIAEKGGLEVVQSDPFHLLLDIDSPEGLAQYERALDRFDSYFSVKSETRWNSYHGNLHIVIELTEPMPVLQRTVLQSFLGSDSAREFWTLLRVRANEEEPSLLFKPTTQETRDTARLAAKLKEWSVIK